MVLGASAALWAVMPLFDMNVRVNGAAMIPYAPSVTWTLVGGTCLIVLGAWLRRHAARRAASASAAV